MGDRESIETRLSGDGHIHCAHVAHVAHVEILVCCRCGDESDLYLREGWVKAVE